MATPFAAFALAYLLSVAFTDELSLNLSYIERLVTYRQNVDFTELIPGALYNGTIAVDWAVPPSALSGIDAQTLAVKVTAVAPENSSVFFPIGNTQAKEATVYLQCKIADGVCANGSTLSAVVPVATSAKADATGEVKISLRSEIVSSVPASYSATVVDTGTIFDSLKEIFSQNTTGYAPSNVSAATSPSASGAINLSDLNISIGALGNNSSSGNFLDTLKPEGDSSDPLLFLKENPLISISALLIVIVITGAYLLNTKD
ncbi:MAG: hypothetical protein WCY41_05035 [Candidatus Micrarchaeia archaeon]